jgi:GNAT superfamily N-acetyltransferase
MVEIRRLSAAELDNFLRFMEGPAFATNPQWAGCYCQFYLNAEPASVTENASAESNRKLACDRINSGEMRGYLAFDGGQTIGWMAANKANNFKLLPPVADDVARILCFVVDEQHQGRGVSTQLLKFAITDLAEQGFSSVEAVPRYSETFTSGGYRGKLSTFLKAGFTEGPRVDEHHVLVHRQLTA